MDKKKDYCQSAVVLAVAGAIIGFVLPSIGVTLAISGLVTNYSERMHYNTEKGLAANVISLVLSVISWLIGASYAGLI
ncbi:MAG: hypothetical protein ACI4Q6_10445 [Huintestinicola sp.]